MHPFVSVIVTVYEPAVKLVIEAVVSLLFHKYEYGVVPPEAEIVIPPSDNPLQVTYESTMEVAVKAFGSEIDVDPFAVHPFASDIVTV